MPDQRSVMKEYRSLDEKRLTQGLTPAEASRLEKLRVLMGPESGAGSIKAGFDVNAAAAALRESLLPAGLRNRPPPTPVAAPPEPPPEPAEPTLGDALAAEYTESPFAPLEGAAEAPQDALFDPSSLGTEPPPYDPMAQAYDASGQGYDPNAYDPNAAYATDGSADPNAPQEYDPNAPQAWDPNQPWDPNAAPAEPGADPEGAYAADAQQPYDPNAPQAWDPNQPWDPGAAPAEAGADAGSDPGAQQAYDPNAQPAYDPTAEQPFDPDAPQAWDPNQPWDPGAVPAEGAAPEAAASADAGYDPNAQQPYDPNAPQAWDPNQPWDPGAAPAEGAEPGEGGAYADAAYDAGTQQAWDAGAAPDAGAELAAPADDVMELGDGELTEVESSEPVAGEAAPPEGGSFAAEAPEAAPGWEAEPLAGEAAPPEGGSFTEEALDTAAGWEAEPAQPEPPQDAAFGEYDAAGAVEPFAPGTLGAEPPLDASLFETRPDAGDAGTFAAPEPAGAAAELGEYDETAGFAAEPFDASALPADAGAGDAGAELDAGWQPDAALSGGFELASGGSFGAGEDAAAPEWAQSSAPPPWEDTGAGLEAPAQPTPEEAGFEIAPPPPNEPFGALPAAGGELFGAPEGDLAAPAEEGLAGDGVGPELDFSHPDFSAGEEAAPDDVSRPLAPGFDVNAHALSPDELGAEPSFADAGASAAEAQAWDASAQDELAAPPALADDQPLLEPTPELAADLASAELIDGADIVPLEDVLPLEEEPASPQAVDVNGFAEAAAAAVASESTDLSAFIEAPPSTVDAPPADDLSFDVAEERPAAASDAATFELPEVAAEAAPALEPGEPEPALAAAPVLDEEIPTIDGADILEELVEDAPAAPPQSLEFEPLEPEPPPAPAVVATPPAPAAVLAPPPPAPAAQAAPSAPDYQVPGAHRVVVHTVEGLVKRGALQDPSLDAAALALEPQPGAPAEEIPVTKVKAIFFMLAPGEKAPPAEGKRVRVTFRDGRQIAGFSPDYHDDGIGFFMIPADTKTNTGRIWVYRAAVRQVAVS